MPAEWPGKGVATGYHEHAYGVLAGPGRAVVRPQPDAAGKLTVGRLEVGKDGVDPGE